MMASSSIVERFRQAGPPPERGLSGLEVAEADGKILVREGRYYTVLTRGIFSAVAVGIGLVLVYTFLVKFPAPLSYALLLLDLAAVAGVILAISRSTRPAVFFEVDGQTGELLVRAGAAEPRRLSLADVRALICRRIELTDGAEFLLYAVDGQQRLIPLTASVVGSDGVKASVGAIARLLERPAYAVDSHALWTELESEGRLRDAGGPREKAELLYAP